MNIGLVFSGGGARGSYEVGVWKALNELDIHCNIVTGVSIGSINAAIYAQEDIDTAIDLWNKIDFSTVFPCENIPKNNKELTKVYLKSVKSGGMEPSNLKKILLENLDINKIYNSSIKYGLCTALYPKFKLTELTLNDINKENFVDFLIASSTIFPVFKLKEIDNVKYIDGGFVNSIPVKLAKKMGANKLIIVNISVFDRKYKPEKNDDVIYIKPNQKLGSPIVFDKNVAHRNLIYGYNDTMKVYKKYYGKKYTFKSLNYIKNNIFNTYDKYVNTLDYLGKTFKIDDTKVYDINDFNKLIIENVKKIIISNKIKFKELNTSSERIAYIYNRLLKNKVVRQSKKKRVINKEYRCAYYIYNL